MLREISELVGLSVYTQGGVYLGNVTNVIIDVERGRIDGLFLADTNPALVDGGKAVSVPYRWVQSMGDVIILRYFPKRVTLRKVPGKSAPLVPQA
ncbi:MAG: PRC-barrel domain-containing protein [Thermoplasmata archaeon]